MSGEIIPDDKNWTWVLEKPCEDCGFEASLFDVLKTGDAIRDQGFRWSDVLQRGDATVRSKSDMWSPLEYGCHVRDVFRKFDERVKLMVNENDPQFENWDQDKTAIEDNYGGQNPSVVANELVDAAETLARRFDAIEPEQWSRRGYRSDGSAFTIESIARYLMHDPVHHLWDVGAEVPLYRAH